MDNHLGRALHPHRLLKGVIGLDIAAVDGLAVVGGLGIHLGQLVVALHQSNPSQIGVAGQFKQQGGPADTAPNDQHIQALPMRQGIPWTLGWGCLLGWGVGHTTLGSITQSR